MTSAAVAARTKREPLLTCKQVAELFGVHERTIYRMATRGEIPAKRFGARAIRFVPEIIQEFLVSKDDVRSPPSVATNALDDIRRLTNSQCQEIATCVRVGAAIDALATEFKICEAAVRAICEMTKTKVSR